MMNTTQRRTCCHNNGGTWTNGRCVGASDRCS
jgi:hypothetical protein